MAFPVSGDLGLLTRVLERVYAGSRRARAIAEALEIDVRVVTGSLDTGEWLGVLTWDGDVRLTPAGLAIALKGRRAGERRAAWANVVREHPFYRLHWPPDPLDLLAITTEKEPIYRKARRQAHALWRISRPGRAPVPEAAMQLPLALPFAPASTRAPLDLRAGLDDNPDVYTLLLRALLDHGEISPAQLRAILDRQGGDRCGVGGYLAMAVRRGDARRLGDVLIVTPGAIRRADLADSPVTVALSDPELRVQLLAHLADGAPISHRFRPWVQRLFGGATVAAGLARVLFDRPLASVPVANDPGVDIDPPATGFLAAWRAGQPTSGHAVAIPTSLRQLEEGLSAQNRALRAQLANAAAPPSPLDRRLIVHGGLVRPGESIPRAIPDGVSLRARAVENAPAFAILVALGLLDRRGRVRLRTAGNDIAVVTASSHRSLPQSGVGLGLLVRTLAHACGWHYTAALDWAEVARIGEAIAVTAQIGDRVTLDEAFFHRLQTDPEHRPLYEGLQPLSEAIHARLRAVG